MATYAETLVRIRDNLAAQLDELSRERKPSYTNNGRSVSWGEYQRLLLDQMKDVEDRIARATIGEVVTVVRGL